MMPPSLTAALLLVFAAPAWAADPGEVQGTPPGRSGASLTRSRRGAATKEAAPKRTPAPVTAAGSFRPLGPVQAGPPIRIHPARPRARAAHTATVLSVAGGRAYLDAGTEDGVAVGQRLAFRRKARESGACTVDDVTDRTATCRATDLRAGDTAPLPSTRPAVEPEVVALAAPLAPAESERRRAAVESAPIAKVEYVAPPEQRSVHDLERLQASLVHASWFASDSTSRHQERVEIRIRGAELGGGWRLFADASGVYRGSSPPDRFRASDSAYLEVRELQVSTREPDRALAVAIGRVLPWYTPGSTLFDGAQVGWRGQAGEIGVFGGAVPDPLTTDPTTSRATGGLYGSIESTTKDVLLHGEGRLAMVKSPELGTRVETELLGHAWLSRAIDLSAQARFGFGGDRTASAALDAARFDLSARLGPAVWVTGGYRHIGLFVAETGAPALFAGPSRHADATVSWDATSWLVLRVTGGYGRDVESGLDRGWAGPELALPRLFGDRSGFAAGWMEERGWAAGRSVWAQVNADGLAGFRVLLRGSLFMDDRPAPYSQESTVGVALTGVRDLASWLRFRLSALGRYAVTSSSESSKLGGLTFLAALDALY